MAETKVRMPDGAERTIRHPEGASREEILRFAKSNYKPSSFGGPFAGQAEAAASVASSALLSPIAGYYGMAAGLIPGGKSGREAVDDVMSYAYRPRSMQGQRTLETIGKVTDPIQQAIQDTSYELSKGVSFDSQGRLIRGGGEPSPAAATAIQMGLEMGPAMFGAKGARLPRSVSPRPMTAPVTPTISELFGVGRVAFNEARIKGGGVRPETLARAADRAATIRNEAGLKIGFNEKLHPKATEVRRQILDSFRDGNVDFDNLLELRQMASDLAGDVDAGEAMRGMRLRNIVDDFVDNLTPDDVLAGNPEQAAQALSQARRFWRDASAAKTIERQINLAEIDAGDTTGAGFENKLRIRFRQLARRIEQGHEKGFTPSEVRLINQVAKGTPIGNVFRQFGKWSPTGVVSTGAGALMGNMLAGPLGVGAVAGGGLLGRHIATQMTINNAQRALNAPLRNSLAEP